MADVRIVDAEPWKETICGCCTDLSTCCYGCICTPCLFGENQKKTSKEDGFCNGCWGYCCLRAGCCCLVHKPARLRFREAYGLEEGSGIASDFCASWCCSICGVCQEAREIRTRGDPPMVTIVSHVRAPAAGATINQPR